MCITVHALVKKGFEKRQTLNFLISRMLFMVAAAMCKKLQQKSQTLNFLNASHASHAIFIWIRSGYALGFAQAASLDSLKL